MASNETPTKKITSDPITSSSKRPRDEAASQSTNKKPKDTRKNQDKPSGTRKSDRNNGTLEKASKDNTIVTANCQKIGENLRKSVKKLREQLQLEDEDDWRNWLRGPFFKPYWDLLWNSWLKHNRPQTGKRGLGLDEVLDIKDQYQQDFIGYPDTSDWGEGQHLAHFMHNVVQRNKGHRDGLFANRAISTRQAENLIWAVLKTMQRLHAPSHINRRSGGLALMNGTEPPTHNSQEDNNTPRTKKGKAPMKPEAAADAENEGDELNRFQHPNRALWCPAES